MIDHGPVGYFQTGPIPFREQWSLLWGEKAMLSGIRRTLLWVFIVVIFVSIPFPAFSSVYLEDDMGREVVLLRPAKRLITLYAAHTENVIALGGKGLLVGVSRSDAPLVVGEGVRRLPLCPGPEMLLALKPDLILMRSMQIKTHPGFLQELEGLELPVLVLDPPGWRDLPFYLDRLGRALGLRQEAEVLLARVTRILKEAEDQTCHRRGSGQRPAVFLVSVGRKLYSCSPDSWAAHLIEAAGGRNVALDASPVSPGSSIARFGIEKLLALSGSLDLMLVQRGKMNDLTAKDISGDPRLSILRCVQQGQVFDIGEEMLSRPSLLRLEETLQILIRLFYGAGEPG